MQAPRTDPYPFALLWGTVKKFGKPRQGHTKDAAVTQVDPHVVLIEADLGCANRRTHSMPFRFDPCSPAPLLTIREGYENCIHHSRPHALLESARISLRSHPSRRGCARAREE